MLLLAHQARSCQATKEYVALIAQHTYGLTPYPFLRYLLLKIRDPNHKTRYLKEGVGYDPLGTTEDFRSGQNRLNLTRSSPSRCTATSYS